MHMNINYTYRLRCARIVLAIIILAAIAFFATTDRADAACDRSCQDRIATQPARDYRRCMRAWARHPMGVTLGEARAECLESIR